MPLVLCHSPKGGAGSSFLAAHLALGLAQQGHAVTALDMTEHDTLKLYFGLAPDLPLPDIEGASDDAVVVSGVTLASAGAASRQPDFLEAIACGDLPFTGAGYTIADLAAADGALCEALLVHARLHLCAVTPSALSLASLKRIHPGGVLASSPRTVFVLNRFNETHRLARHTRSFLRELLGDRMVGVVRSDESINEAPAMGLLLAAHAPASAALADVAALVPAVEALCGASDTRSASEAA